ncbi:MAG: SRPBCC family protein [Bacteroidia bacterium]
MNTIMIIIFCIAIIIALLLIVAALVSNKSFIEQTITINQPAQTVYDYLKHVKNHDKFSIWAMMDPEMKREYRGTDGTVGFVFYWHSDKKNNVGTGEQEIKQLVNGQKVEFELRFIKPFQSTSKAVMTTQPVGESQTKVSWSLESEMKFPMKIMKPMIENMLTKNLQQGLQNLKTILETK